MSCSSSDDPITHWPHSRYLKMGKLDFVIDSCLDNIELVGTCVECLASRVFEDQQCNEIKLCVHEAITNCIKHSYRGSPGHKIYISLQLEEDRLTLDIADCGLAMNPVVLDNTTTHFEANPENLEEGGMGLKILKILMDDLHYHTTNGMNHFILVKYANSPSNPNSLPVQ